MGSHGRIGDIQPFTELAQSATTVVYKGYQRSLERFVLLKVLRPSLSQDAERVRRFEAEAQLVAQIQHPNVVAIYACGQEDGQSYLATEFIEGFDVASVLAHGPLPVELATFILLEAARGLQAAHRRGVLHRDIKPANILVSHEGHVKLTDFGMASLAEDDADTVTEVRGTWGYIAPEQVRGEAPSPAADLFSLGATVFEILVARPPFTGTAPHDRIDALLHHDPLPLLDRFAEVPADLRAICARLLAKTPQHRYTAAATLISDLEAFRNAHGLTAAHEALAAYLDDPTAYRPVSPLDTSVDEAVPVLAPETAPPAVSTPRHRWGLAVLLVVVTVGLGVLLLRTLPDADRPEADRQGPVVETTAPTQSSAADSNLVAADTVAGDVPADVPEPLAALPDTADASLPDTDAQPVEQQDAEVEPAADTTALARGTLAGTLTVQVSPWAEVHIDGQPLGRTPLREALTLTPGLHQLVLEHPRFPAYRTTVEIRPGEAQHIAASLWDLVGTLTLEVSPWAEVTVDGERRDTTPLDHALILTPGRHHLTLDNPALGRWDTTLTIVKGEVSTLRINLHQLLAQ